MNDEFDAFSEGHFEPFLTVGGFGDPDLDCLDDVMSAIRAVRNARQVYEDDRAPIAVEDAPEDVLDSLGEVEAKLVECMTGLVAAISAKRATN